MKFTVVIPFSNNNKPFRLRNLQQVIINYNKLASDFDIVVVEQNGNGEVRDALKDYKIKYLNIETPSNLFHKTLLLNKAISTLKTDYIIMSDADCLLTDIGIESIRTECDKGSILFPFSSVNYYNEMNTRRYCKGEQSINANDDRNLPIKRFTGLVNCFSMETFNQVGGFDDDFIGWGAEDDAFVIKCERIKSPVYRTNLSSEVIHLFHPKVDNPEYKQSDIYINNKKRVACIKRMSDDDLKSYVTGNVKLDKLISKYESLNMMDLELKWRLGNSTVKLDSTIYDMDNISDMSISKILQCIYDVDGRDLLHQIINTIDIKVTGLTESQKQEINTFRNK